MVGAGGSGLRAINGTVEFNGNTVINLIGDVAYIDRYVPAFGIWNGATPMALLQLPAHMLSLPVTLRSIQPELAALQ